MERGRKRVACWWMKARRHGDKKVKNGELGCGKESDGAVRGNLMCVGVVTYL